MDALTAMSIVWGLITAAFVGLLLYKGNINRQEKDWIALSNDAREESAIQAQMARERQSQRLVMPLRTLGFISLAMFVFLVGFWIYHALYTTQAMQQ